MLLNISFQHRFIVFFNYTCQNVSRTQNKGGVNSVDAILLKQTYSLIICHYVNLTVSHIPRTVKFIEFNIIWGEKKNKCYLKEVLISRKRLKYSQSQDWVEVFHLSRTVFIMQLWQVNRTQGDKLISQNKDRKIIQQLQTQLVEDYLNYLFIKNRAR